MGEDSSHADRSVSTLPGSTSTPTSPAPEDNQEILTSSFSPSSAPSSPLNTLTRLAGKSPTSPSSPGGQVSAITVVALLDKVVNMIESVQENQRRVERKQAELEAAVRGVQGDVTRLAKSHTTTSNSVAKLLERSRKTGGHVKEVRDRMDRQAVQIRRLEANHAHLLKRNHFKVLIFQEDNEIPSSVFMKDGGETAGTSSLAEPRDETPAPAPTPATDANRSHEEGLQTISLSSEEDVEAASTSPLAAADSTDPLGDQQEDDLPGPDSERLGLSRADKFKRSSLKKVDSLKKAFSRRSIEKKINKIVPPERREKIKKSFTPNHPKSPSDKSSSFRVSPMTFNVKKVREGDNLPSPSSISPVEVPSMGGPDGQLPLAEVYSHEEQAEEGEPQNPSSPGSVDGNASVTEDGGDAENHLSGRLAEEEVLQEHDEDEDDDDDDDGIEENGIKEESSSVEAETPTSAPAVVQQAS
ncbi:caveolae-associated protein 2a [Chanos chanos]|uniref:Caveolae-associated protein 2a n=1 Tax=Chanos chanos TaxID=29144 RepID=A0A6J2WEL8_CHACN|nr:caveolae-associated protein 2 [Chanos chanos]